MNTSAAIDLQPFHIQRPEKIRWMYDICAPTIESTLHSQTLLKVFEHVDELIEKYQVNYEHLILDEKIYQAWWQHYYDVTTQKKYDVIAPKEWLSLKHKEGKIVGGFFFFHQDKNVGSLLYTKKDNYVIAAFKTSSEVPGLSKKHRSLGAIIDYIFLRSMLPQKPEKLSLGSMRNAYGVFNSIGNLEFKLSMGYLPIVKEDTSLLESVPVQDSGRVVFFGIYKGTLQLFCFKPEGDEHIFDIERFKNDTMTVTIIAYQK